MKLRKYWCLLLLGSLLLSCVKNIDFEQAENYDAKPKYVASLVFFKIPASGFLNSSGNEIITPVIDESRLSIMEEKVIQENLVEAVLDFEINNPFNRSIFLSIQFFDDFGAITHSINTIEIAANTSSLLHKEIITITNNSQFLNTRRIRVSLLLSTTTGSPIDINDLNEFVLKSAGTFTFKI